MRRLVAFNRTTGKHICFFGESTFSRPKNIPASYETVMYWDDAKDMNYLAT